MPTSDYHTLAADFFYEVRLLAQMFEQLPPKVAMLLTTQLDKTMRANSAMINCVRDTVVGELGDLELYIKSQEFDLDATKREKQALQDFVDGLNS